MWIERNALHLPSHRANTPRARVIYLGDQQYAKLEFAKDGYRFVAVLFRAWFKIALVSLIHLDFRQIQFISWKPPVEYTYIGHNLMGCFR